MGDRKDWVVATHQVLPPPIAGTKLVEVQRGIGHLSLLSGSFSSTMAIWIDIPGRSPLGSDIVSTWSESFALKISKSPAMTSFLPGPCLNLTCISALSASILHSEENGNTRPKTSSTLTGSWKKVKRVSMPVRLVLSSSTIV